MAVFGAMIAAWVASLLYLLKRNQDRHTERRQVSAAATKEFSRAYHADLHAAGSGLCSGQGSAHAAFEAAHAEVRVACGVDTNLSAELLAQSLHNSSAAPALRSRRKLLAQFEQAARDERKTRRLL